ncbi:MAG: ribosome-associated translation inhibitor RaiA [Candidatus Rokubacteria bacterium]|nr:ribosome-associated translation inhibitor RaiA [Candidatus Rokubacteria bacterium]
MQVIISGRGVVLTPAFKARIGQKVQKFSRILPKIHEAKVVLSAEKYRRTAEVTLLGKGRIFHSEETAPDLAAAVDLAVEALARQVRQTKDRLRQRKLRVSPRRAPLRIPRDTGEAGNTPVVVSRRQVAPKPMSVEEAAMQLGLRRDQFLVFTNAATDALNVLYRRKDGALGLIEPVA